MDIETIIGELKFSLEHLASEEKLLNAIAERMPGLRQSFRLQKSRFTPNHIRFLKSLTPIAHELQSFIDLRDKLPDVGTLEDHAAMVSRLTGIRNRLRPFAVCGRVMKALRGLNEKLPTIRQQIDGKWLIRANARIIDLEQDAPRCRRNHAMAIRQGPYEYYWGCSRYPFCGEATPLTLPEKRRLDP